MAKNKSKKQVQKKQSERVSSLIVKHGTYSTTPNSKYISTPDFNKGEGHYKYIPKTKANLRALNEICGKPDVYDDKRGGKRFIWW